MTPEQAFRHEKERREFNKCLFKAIAAVSAVVTLLFAALAIIAVTSVLALLSIGIVTGVSSISTYLYSRKIHIWKKDGR